MSLTKRQRDALEQVFAAEIEGRLPFQSRAGIYRALREEGLVTPMERTAGAPPFRVLITGYQLTHRGRLLYCESCDAPKTAPKAQRRRAPVA